MHPQTLRGGSFILLVALTRVSAVEVLQDGGFEQTDPVTLQNPFWGSSYPLSPRGTALCDTGNATSCSDAVHGSPHAGRAGSSLAGNRSRPIRAGR